MGSYDGTGNFDLMTTALNNSLKDGNNISNPFELKAIEENRHMSGIFKTCLLQDYLYKEWNLLLLYWSGENDDTQVVAEYIMTNDFGGDIQFHTPFLDSHFPMLIQDYYYKDEKVAFLKFKVPSYYPNIFK